MEFEKVTRKIEVVEVSHVYISIPKCDQIPDNFPKIDGEQVEMDINIETGQIEDWTGDEGFYLHVKVCDTGLYQLHKKGDHTAVHATIDCGYVPNQLIPGDYGDYIELYINKKGLITNWPEEPSLFDFESAQ